MRALLSVSVISAVGCANEDRGIACGRIIEIQTAVRREHFGPFDVSRGQRLRRARVERCFRCEARSSDKQRRRSQSEKIAELTSSDLCFLVAFVGKLSLVRRRGGAYIVLVWHMFLPKRFLTQRRKEDLRNAAALCAFA